LVLRFFSFSKTISKLSVLHHHPQVKGHLLILRGGVEVDGAPYMYINIQNRQVRGAQHRSWGGGGGTPQSPLYPTLQYDWLLKLTAFSQS
jgi:hypothetical protein